MKYSSWKYSLDGATQVIWTILSIFGTLITGNLTVKANSVLWRICKNPTQSPRVVLRRKKSIRKGLLSKFSVKFPEKCLRRSSILAKLHALSQLTETPINCCFYSINQAISQNFQICFWLGNSWVTSIIETVSNFSTLCCNFLVISWSLNF